MTKVLKTSSPVCHRKFVRYEDPPLLRPPQYSKEKKHWYQYAVPVRYCKHCKIHIINPNEGRIRLCIFFNCFIGSFSGFSLFKYIFTHDLVYLIAFILIALLSIPSLVFKRIKVER